MFVLVAEILAGCGLWCLVGKKWCEGLPAWGRLYAGALAALVVEGTFRAFWGDLPALDGILYNLAANLIVGYCFAELLRLDNPLFRSDWRKTLKRLRDGGYRHQ